MAFTLGQSVEQILGKPWKKPTARFLSWPPDSFAVAAHLLFQTGAYIHCAASWPPDFMVFDALADPEAYGCFGGP